MSERIKFSVDSEGETRKEEISNKEFKEINRAKREQAEKTLRASWETVYKAAATGGYEEAIKAMNEWWGAEGDFLEAGGDWEKLHSDLARNLVRKGEDTIAKGNLSKEQYEKYQTVRDETNPHTPS